MSPAGPGSAHTPRAAHHAAVAEFVAAARGLPADDWARPVVEGKWSPAEIAEHLRLTYETLAGELGGAPGIRPRGSWWSRMVLRFSILPGILRTGRIPGNARAPREIRPGGGPFDQRTTLAALETAAAAFEDRLGARHPAASAVLTHHFFGRLSVAEAWRFAAVHTDHHRRQLETRVRPGEGAARPA